MRTYHSSMTHVTTEIDPVPTFGSKSSSQKGTRHSPRTAYWFEPFNCLKPVILTIHSCFLKRRIVKISCRLLPKIEISTICHLPTVSGEAGFSKPNLLSFAWLSCSSVLFISGYLVRNTIERRCIG